MHKATEKVERGDSTPKENAGNKQNDDADTRGTEGTSTPTTATGTSTDTEKVEISDSTPTENETEKVERGDSTPQSDDADTHETGGTSSPTTTTGTSTNTEKVEISDSTPKENADAKLNTQSDDADTQETGGTSAQTTVTGMSKETENVSRSREGIAWAGYMPGSADITKGCFKLKKENKKKATDIGKILLAVIPVIALITGIYFATNTKFRECICPNGIPVSDERCTSLQFPPNICASCNTGYHLDTRDDNLLGPVKRCKSSDLHTHPNTTIQPISTTPASTPKPQTPGRYLAYSIGDMRAGRKQCGRVYIHKQVHSGSMELENPVRIMMPDAWIAECKRTQVPGTTWQNRTMIPYITYNKYRSSIELVGSITNFDTTHVLVQDQGFTFADRVLKLVPANGSLYNVGYKWGAIVHTAQVGTIMVGGYSHGIERNGRDFSDDVIQILPNNKRKQLPKMGSQRKYHSATYYDNAVFVFGGVGLERNGDTDVTHLTIVEKLHLSTSDYKWTRLPSLSVKMAAWYAVVIHANQAYIFKDKIYLIYNLETGTEEVTDNIFKSPCNKCGIYYDQAIDKIAVFGGRGRGFSNNPHGILEMGNMVANEVNPRYEFVHKTSSETKIDTSVQTNFVHSIWFQRP